MKNVIDKMPPWARRLLALPLAFAGFMLVHFVCGLIIPANYSTKSLAAMKDVWIEQYFVVIAAISVIECVLAAYVFMSIIYRVVPIKKYTVVLAASVTWIVLLFLSYAIIAPGLYPDYIWTLFNSMISGLATAAFLVMYTWHVRKKQKVRGGNGLNADT